MPFEGRHIFCAFAALTFVAAAAPAVGVEAGVNAWMAKDFAGAVRVWRPIADRGDADAQFNMGQAYKMGRGVPSDVKIAQSWFQKAAQQGHEKAQANLGLLLFNSGDRAGAMPWIRKAAERGDARAQYVLGTETFNGTNVAKDWPRAYALMTRAAAQGLAPAGNSLTQMDRFIPLPDRQKGVAMARDMEAAQRGRAASPPPPPSSAVVSAPTGPAPAPRATQAPAPTRPAAAPATRGWRVQLGAFGSQELARSQWSSMAKRVPALAALQPSYEPAGALTRLRVGPLANRAAADKACASAKGAGIGCFPVAP